MGATQRYSIDYLDDLSDRLTKSFIKIKGENGKIIVDAHIKCAAPNTGESNKFLVHLRDCMDTGKFPKDVPPSTRVLKKIFFPLNNVSIFTEEKIPFDPKSIGFFESFCASNGFSRGKKETTVKTEEQKSPKENIKIDVRSDEKSVLKIDRPFEFSDRTYFGRENEKIELIEFLNNKTNSLQLIYGIGGIGKTHLVYSIKNILKISNEIYINCPKESSYSLQDIASVLEIDVSSEISQIEVSEKINSFIRSINRLVIIDNFHNIIDQTTRDIIKKWAYLKGSKIIVISRNFPDELINNVSAKEDAIQVGFIPYPQFKEYILDIHNAILEENDIEKIYTKTNGYPYVALLILNGISAKYPLEEILDDLNNFDDEFNLLESDKNVNRLLNNIFDNGDKKEIQLLLEMSALVEPASLNLIQKLDGYSIGTFRSLSFKRSFIFTDRLGKFIMPDIIKEFAYPRLQNKEVVHQTIGFAYFEKFQVSESFDHRTTKEIIHHFSLCNNVAFLDEFREDFKAKFAESKTKSFLDSNHEMNISIYETLVEANLNNVKYLSHLSSLYRNNGQFNEGFDLVNNSLKMEKFKDESYLLVERSRYYVIFDQVQNAIEDLVNAKKNDQNYLPIKTTLAKLFLSQKMYEEARQEFIDWITYQENEVFRMFLKKVANRENNKIEVYDLLQQEYEIYRKTHNIKFQLGQIYLKLKEPEKAERQFLDAIILDDNKIIYRKKLGITYLTQGKDDLAEEQFLKITSMDPKNIFSVSELGKLYTKQGRFKEAENQFLNIKGIKEENIFARMALGDLYSSQGREKKAELEYKQILDINKDFVLAKIRLADLYIKQNRNIDSIIQIKEIILRNDEMIQYKQSLLKDSNDIEQKRVLRSIASIQRKMLPRMIKLAGLYLKENQNSEAKNLYEDIILIDEQNFIAKKQLGLILFKEGAIDESEQYLLEASKIDNDDIAVKTKLGSIYAEQKKYEQAEKLFNSVVSLEEGNTFAINSLGKIYFEQNLIRSSIRVLEKARQYNTNKNNFYLITTLLYGYLKLKDIFRYTSLLNYARSLKESKNKYLINKFSDFMIIPPKLGQ